MILKYLGKILSTMFAGIFLLGVPAFADTIVDSDITTDTTWTLAGSPYIVTVDVSIYGPNGQTTTLTIEPGVVVKFNPGVGLFVGHPTNGVRYGAINAVGTFAQPITFTSNSATPLPGDWKGLYLRDNTNDTLTMFDYSIIEYAGQTNNANIYINVASPTITNSTIRYSSGYGIYVASGSPTINNNILTNNATYPISALPDNFANFGPNTATGNGSGNGIELRGAVIGQPITNIYWPNTTLPYIVTGDIELYYVDGGGGGGDLVLTIAPGTTVTFNPNTGLYFGHPSVGARKGSLNAQGTPTQPIIFTSSLTTPAPGSWEGIYFRDATSDSLTILNYCIVRYAGQLNGANIFINNASPTITNSTITDSSAAGIYILGGSPVLNNNALNNNATYPISTHIMSCSNIGPNTATGNGSGNGIELRGAVIGQPITNIYWPNTTLPYIVTGDIELYYVDGGGGGGDLVLTIAPGTTVTFNPNTGLYFGHPSVFARKGALNAQGTPTQPIIFTSSLTTPTPGSWKGIYFSPATNSSLTILNYCQVEYGGYPYYFQSSNIFIDGISLEITNSIITNGGGSGIYSKNTSSSMTDSTISFNNESGIYIDGGSPTINNNVVNNNGNDGIYISGSTPNIKYNIFQGNGGYGLSFLNSSSQSRYNDFISNTLGGINNASAGLIEAEYSWWGDASGPSGAGPGTGQSVGNNVTYEPWSGEPVNESFYFFNAVISPREFNQHGDRAVLHAEMNENANWQIVIKDATAIMVRNFSGAGNSINQEWPGDDNSGQPLPNGTYTYTISAQSTVNPGETASLVGRLILDDTLLLPIISDNTVTERFFKRRLHGTTSIQYSLAVDAYVTVKIFNYETVTLVRTLVNNQLRIAGSHAEVWDGTDDSVQILPDGVYTYTIDAQTLDGEFGRYDPPRSNEPVLVTSLTTAPAPFSAIKGDRLAINYDLTAPALVTMGFQNQIVFFPERPAPAIGNTDYWSGRDNQGAIVTGTVWMESTAERIPENFIVIADDRTLDISVLTTDPYLIRPVYNETTRITYNINEPATATVKILSQNASSVIKVLEQGVFKPAGTHNIIWDGRDTTGATVVTPGDYRVRVEAIDAYGETTMREGNIRVLY